MKVKSKTVFTCQNCGYQNPGWLGRCPECSSWNSFVEETYTEPQAKTKKRFITHDEEPVLLDKVKTKETFRLPTDIRELDRVLGGGIISGSVTLIGGDPGIGKSTIALQISNNLSSTNHKVLYVSGEESVQQTKMRADRLRHKGDGSLYLVNQTDLTCIFDYINKIKPEVVVVDSIQVIFHPDITSSAGSVSQVRECAGMLTQLAKSTQTSLFIIGHVTKEGAIAGPRVLEHIVDTVLYFEGDRFSAYRILRAVKNRFGSTNEIGVFEMTDAGLAEVANPSEIFLSERAKETPGSVVVSCLEGSRPLLVEVQALVSKAGFGYARRRCQGVDYNRLGMLVAVLEKRMGLKLWDEDIFVNIAGGIKVDDPAIDLGICIAIASSLKDKEVNPYLVSIGEVGLAGEVRSVSQLETRSKEAQKLGFKYCLVPKNNLKMRPGIAQENSGFKVIGVSSVKEALNLIGEVKL